MCLFFVFNDTATTEIYTLSLHDALPIFMHRCSASMTTSTPRGSSALTSVSATSEVMRSCNPGRRAARSTTRASLLNPVRSEEHTSELQSRQYLVCRLLLEKKKTYSDSTT